jgi:hypothetical protein
MDAFVEHFRDGGWGMFPTLFFGVLLLGVAVMYAVNPDRRFAPLLLGLGTLTLATGGLGFVTGLIATCHAIGADASFHAQPTLIAILGFGESLNNVAFALIFVVLAALSASCGAFRTSRRRDARAAVG